MQIIDKIELIFFNDLHLIYMNWNIMKVIGNLVVDLNSGHI